MRFDCTPEVKPSSKTPPGDCKVVLAVMVELRARVPVFLDPNWATTDVMTQSSNMRHCPSHLPKITDDISAIASCGNCQSPSDVMQHSGSTALQVFKPIALWCRAF